MARNQWPGAKGLQGGAGRNPAARSGFGAGIKPTFRGRRTVPPCRVCRRKLSRAKLDGCCLLCARVVGVLPATTFYAQQAIAFQAIQVKPEWKQPRPAIPVVVDGVEMEIVWNGQ
jgi:hypothetical protein